MLHKNQHIPLTIETLTNEGNGLGRHDGMVVFVPLTAPGDHIEAKIVKTGKSFCYGILHQLVTSAPCRTAQTCSVYEKCGGCALRHITYEAELNLKTGWVTDALRRIGGLSLEGVDLRPILPSPQTERYRNKAQYPVTMEAGKPAVGFFARRSHHVIPCGDCLLQPAAFSQIADIVTHWIERYGVSVYDEATGEGLLRHLYLRCAETTGQIMVCLVLNSKKNALPYGDTLIESLRRVEGVASIICNLNAKNTNVILGEKCCCLWGSDTIVDRLVGIDVALSPLSFYQVNRQGAEQLYAAAAALAAVGPNELLLDLYCGAGTIGLSIAKATGCALVGVEVVPEAVRDAEANALANGIPARFLCADAGEAAARLWAETLYPDVVILDPPRKGCDPPTIEAVCQMAPKRIVMVSCNPATMARDVKAFVAAGYCLQTVQPVDMFPRTTHVEMVVLMTKVA